MLVEPKAGIVVDSRHIVAAVVGIAEVGMMIAVEIVRWETGLLAIVMRRFLLV